MARSYRLTGFARFFIVMLLLVPIAFFVASYINNEDPIEGFNKLIGKETTKTEEVISDKKTQENAQNVEQANSQAVNTDLKEKVKKLEDKVKDLESKLYQKNEEIIELKNKLAEKSN